MGGLWHGSNFSRSYPKTVSIPFNQLATSDIVVDQVYDGGPAANAGAEPISKLLPGTGNMGGFRIANTKDGKGRAWIVLFTSGEDLDWPDSLDPTTGRFVYFGDNKSPGHSLHETPKKGNQILRDIFETAHSSDESRANAPPIFVFTKNPNAAGKRSVRFLGLAVPGSEGIPHTEDLVAIWRTTSGRRFQNYKATFTILDCPEIDRRWLADLKSGIYASEFAPKAWTDWANKRIYRPLVSPATASIRELSEQLPNLPDHIEILRTIWTHFRDDPWSFESFAAWLYGISDERVVISKVTQRTVDGGRDAIGKYRLGLESDPVFIDFSLEAKCYNPGVDGQSVNTVGVKEMSRLISRLRHRHFGVLVTTSAVARQAYSEVREDQHPIQIICGRDIVSILISKGFSTATDVALLLRRQFPIDVNS